MAISEIDAFRAEKLLQAFCEARVSTAVRNQVELLVRQDGDAFELYERRPYFRDPAIHTESPIARFAYDAANSAWMLLWSNQHGDWHFFEDGVPDQDISVLIRRVDKDETGIFWG